MQAIGPGGGKPSGGGGNRYFNGEGTPSPKNNVNINFDAPAGGGSKKVYGSQGEAVKRTSGITE